MPGEPTRAAKAASMFVKGFVSIAVLAAIAMATRQPFLFPSLGPTAFLFFFAPTMAPACPRNTMCGHAIGLLCGYAALRVTGLHDDGPAYATGVDAARVIAAALSLAGTGAMMILFDVPHPPAGATTLIVSLGVVTGPHHLVVMAVAIGVITLVAIAIHRATGQPYPLWGPLPPK